MKKTLTDINFDNKVVIARVDFNVPIKMDQNNQQSIADDTRILAALPTINYLLEKNVKLILLSHLGRIKQPQDLGTKSLKIVAQELQKHIKNKVIFVNKTQGQEVLDAVKNLQKGEVLFLENTRFEDLNDKAESKNNPELAKFWASLADVFVNDAFGTSHRSHASNVGIASNIKESCLGFLMAKEIQNLDRIKNNPPKPFVSIIGGAKISDKIQVLEKLLGISDHVLIGGAMAYTFLKSQGHEVGQSLVENDYLQLASQMLTKYADKIVLPVDSAMSKEFADIKPVYKTYASKTIESDDDGMDIGSQTVELFSSYIKEAKSIFWNGPLGVTEFDNFAIGTKAIATAISQNNDCFSVVGGGDSVAAIKKLQLVSKFSFISTGGGASLEFVQDASLPGYECIENK
ncbi:phosphoglycerate kinase [[Mycoplasma] gypis]|uniref:Phosphoglycerate kinase n=1 Tax=[Mycoplasma] gypis TaxID=92404 RepID=A0ABZ2RN84_9BACT|nr:phosphoglycerate kinase [[Mycoplasma] gypis]MBN0919089.1 phosphoglycerate kinase [[Mycoplasma] gypis]